MAVDRRRGSEAGFSMLEAVLAVVILGVVGFALHQATLSGLRYMQAGKTRAQQARRLEYAIDWARAEACYIKGQLAPDPEAEPFVLALYDNTEALLRWRPNLPGDPPGVLTVELTLLDEQGDFALAQWLLLDLGGCR